MPPNTPTQPVTLEFREQSGTVLTEHSGVLLRRDDPNTAVMSLSWQIDFAPDG